MLSYWSVKREDINLINTTGGDLTEHFKDEAQTALFKDPVRTALYTLFISVIKTNQFML